MRNLYPSTDEERDESKNAVFQHWWRTSDDSADENSHLKLDLSDISKLTPRLKLCRELERLALISQEGLDDLRHKLITYRSGDFWLPVGGIKKEDMDIPPIISILLVGLPGSGKSSLVNLMYSVLGRSGLVPFAQTSSMLTPSFVLCNCTSTLKMLSEFVFLGDSSSYTTMFMEEHNVLRSMRSGFCVYDTRGLDEDYLSNGLEEVSRWMTEGVQHNQLCYRPGDGTHGSTINLPLGSLVSSARFARRRVNCVLVVANLAETYKAFKCGDLAPVQAIREIFHFPSIRKSSKLTSPLNLSNLQHGSYICNLKSEVFTKTTLESDILLYEWLLLCHRHIKVPNILDEIMSFKFLWCQMRTRS